MKPKAWKKQSQQDCKNPADSAKSRITLCYSGPDDWLGAGGNGIDLFKCNQNPPSCPTQNSPFFSRLFFRVYYHFWNTDVFFLPSSLLFFRLSCSHIIWDCHSQRTGTKTGWVLFGLVLYLNFPCKYVVSGCFPFLFFFPICSFSILKTESEHRANGRNWLERKGGKQKAEVPGLLVLILLLDFTLFYFRPEHWVKAGGMGTRLLFKCDWKSPFCPD